MSYRFEKFLFKIEKVIVTLFLAVMFLAVVLQVGVRYFNLPIINTTEMSVMIMSLITFIGAGLAIYTKDHISIEIHRLFRSTRIKFLFELFTSLCMMIFACVFLVLGYDLFVYAVETGSRTVELRLPLYIPYGTMILGLVLMIIHTISNLINLFWRGSQSVTKVDTESEGSLCN